MKLVDVVVVGGGLAGLIAAHDTARRGLGTVVFEAAPELGGRAQTRIVEGFYFNQGPHAFYVNGAFHKALRSFGIKVSDERIALGSAIALWGNQRHPLPVSLETLQRATPLTALERLQLGKTFGEVALGVYDNLGQPLSAFTRCLRPRVANIIETLIRLVTYVNAPDVIDGKAALDQLRLAFGGVLYVGGGWGALVAGLAAAATAAGADLRTRSTIAKVRRQEKGWLLSGPGIEDHLASSVVLAVAPQMAATIAGQLPGLAASVQKNKPVRLMCLDLGLSKLPNPEVTSP